MDMQLLKKIIRKVDKNIRLILAALLAIWFHISADQLVIDTNYSIDTTVIWYALGDNSLQFDTTDTAYDTLGWQTTTDSIYMFVKLGDLKSFKHLEPMVVHDYTDWIDTSYKSMPIIDSLGDTTGYDTITTIRGGPPILSYWNNTVYKPVKFSRVAKDSLRRVCAINDSLRGEGSTKRITLDSTKFTVAERKTFFDDKPNPIKRYASYDIIRPIRDTKGEAVILDVHAVSSGTYDCGSGGDYATLKLGLDDATTQTGDLIFRATSDQTWTSTNIDWDVSGYLLKVTSDSFHYGDVDKGWLIGVGTTQNIIRAWSVDQSSGSEIVICSLNVIVNQALQHNNKGFLGINHDYTNDFDIYFHHNLIDCNDSLDKVFFAISNVTTPLLDYYIYNNLMFDAKNSGTAGGIQVKDFDTCMIVNNTLWRGCRIHVDNDAAIVTNNVCYFESGSDAYTNIGSATGNNNWSNRSGNADGNWSSGSGNITNGDTATQFHSVDESDGFLSYRPDDGSDLDGAQTTSPISGHTKHMNGKTINAIGAKSYRDYSTGNFNVGPDDTLSFPLLSQANECAIALTGNVTLTVTAPFTDDAKCKFNFNGNGNTFKITSDNNHLGNPDSGHVITVTVNDDYFFWLAATTHSSIPTYEIEKLNIYKATPHAAGNAIFRINNFANDVNIYIHDNIVNCNDSINNFIRNDQIGDARFRIYNNMAWDSRDDLIFINTQPDSFIFVNNTLYDAQTDNFDATNDALDSLINNAIFLSQTSNEYDQIGNCNGKNNAGSDGTGADGNWASGSGNLPSLTTADQFVSLLDNGGDDYLLPKGTGSLGGGQTTSPIPGHTTHINGYPLNSIGAKGLPTDRYWIGGEVGSETDWDEANNWAFTSGGSGGAGVPGGGNRVALDGNSTDSCILSANSACSTIIVTTGFTYNFNMNSNTFTIDSTATFNSDGTGDLNINDALTVSDYNLTVGTWNAVRATSGTITIDGGNASTVTSNSNALGAITVDKSGSGVTLGDALDAVSLDMDDGNFDFNGQTVTLSGKFDWTSADALTADALLTIDANALVRADGETLNRIKFNSNPTITWQASESVSITNYTATDWDGATFVSSTPTTQASINLGAAATVSNMTVTDNDNNGTRINAYNGTNTDGGNNTGWDFFNCSYDTSYYVRTNGRPTQIAVLLTAVDSCNSKYKGALTGASISAESYNEGGGKTPWAVATGGLSQFGTTGIWFLSFTGVEAAPNGGADSIGVLTIDANEIGQSREYKIIWR